MPELSTPSFTRLEKLLATQDRERLLQILVGQARVLEMIAEDAPLRVVLGELLAILERQVDGMLGSVLLLSEDGKRLRHGAAPSLPASYNAAIDGAAIGPTVGSCGTAAFLRRQVIVADIETDPLWVDYKALALEAGLRACWSTPILSRDGDVLGTFAMYYREPTQPSPVHFDWIVYTTHLAGIAIQRRRQNEERDKLLHGLKLAIGARDRFISVAAHELKSPLASLRLKAAGLLMLLKASPISVDNVAKKAVAAIKDIEQFERLISDLLDASRVDVTPPTLHCERGDLAEIVRDVVERCADAFGGNRLTMRADAVVIGDWDKTRIEQVVTNLLSNARKFGLGRPVSVAVSLVSNKAHIDVRDHGIGIASDDFQVIFERFGRAASEGRGGFGLGLWIARQVVDAMGGTISVESEVGHGSTFTIALPLT
jgi:signal transduction histidine kinase